MVVDDNSLNRMVLMKIIRSFNLNGCTASNGLEALQMIKDKKEISLILMDLMMPIMDGYEATRKIRELKSSQDLPIVAVTADSSDGLPTNCLVAGFNDLVTKPVRKDEIEQILKKYLIID